MATSPALEPVKASPKYINIATLLKYYYIFYQCAEFVSQRLHLKLLAKLAAKKEHWEDEQLREVLRATFLELDEEFIQKHRTDPDGCTAVLALVMGRRLLVAWV